MRIDSEKTRIAYLEDEISRISRIPVIESEMRLRLVALRFMNTEAGFGELAGEATAAKEEAIARIEARLKEIREEKMRTLAKNDTTRLPTR